MSIENIADSIHELRLEIAKNLTVDQVIEITEAQVRAEAENKQLKAKISKEVSDTGHRLNTWEMNMVDIKRIQIENKQLNGKLDKLRFDRQAELTELERKTHIKYDKEIKQLKANWDELKEYANKSSVITWLKMKTIEERV